MAKRTLENCSSVLYDPVKWNFALVKYLVMCIAVFHHEKQPERRNCHWSLLKSQALEYAVFQQSAEPNSFVKHLYCMLKNFLYLHSKVFCDDA
jgi:hypothetical protein